MLTIDLNDTVQALPFLPVLFAWAAPFAMWFVRFAIIGIIIRVVISFGVAFASFVLLDGFADLVRVEVGNLFGQLGSDVSSFVGLMRIDDAFTVILSAWSWKFAFISLRQLKLIRVPST